MPVEEASINNIMSGIENTGGVKQHNHKKKLRQRFDIIKKLGQGTFGKVQLGLNKETGQEVAIKTIKKSKIESEADLIRIRREIQIMSSVQHPNIIHIYEVFENKEKMVLVMEYAAGGELYDYLSERKVLPEEEARRIFRQIATASYYCHKHKICHRDLKLENILLDEHNNAKIADFGLSNVFDDQRLLNTFCGSPLYASPEIVKGTPYQGPEVDCWSLGVLLYTLVYGAMPFDGSNFKRLVKQISQGDYFEPAVPSPASPLIREMLTVNPKRRANIEKICTHWWVNENYSDNCLEISEELANQTPVRLDVLLSLAPPPPQLESDKLLVTGDVSEEASQKEAAAPTRSQSVGSLMELAHPAERRIKDLLNEEKSPKRKLETTVSTDRANLDKGLSRREKIIKENTVADITVHGAIQENASMEDASMSESAPLNRSLTKTLSKDMDYEQTEETIDPSLAGAACTEILEEAEKKELKKPSKIKKTLSTTVSNKVLEGINEIPSQENVPTANNSANNLDKENIEGSKPQEKEHSLSPESKTPAKRKVVKKKVLADKNENNSKSKTPSPQPEEKVKPSEDKKDVEVKAEEPAKPIERRRSRIFEAAEKFQNMLTPAETKPTVTEKPKKIVIPGVSVDGFKKEFERKASLTSTSPPKLKSNLTQKKILIDKQKSEDDKAEAEPKPIETPTIEPKKTDNDEQQERVRNAVNIISSALDKEGTRKSKSRPCMMRKPPVPFGASGRSASGNIGMITSPVVNSLGPKPFVKAQFDKPAGTEAKKVEERPEQPQEEKTSSAEITLKSATLPRRKTTKAQIHLNYPEPKPATMEFKTEMAHNVEAGPKAGATQRSEVVVPVRAPTTVGFRSTSLEPEVTKASPKERIIPISFERSETVQSPPAKPPVPRPFQTQRSTQSQRSESFSRQSTQDSDTETVASTGEPIRKAPGEYIIPIAVEGGGYVTPRGGSLEPSDTASTTSTMTNKSQRKNRFASGRRLNDSEDESPFSMLHRHSSFGKDSDAEDSRRDAFHMHRLRSTRPKKTNIDHNDSLSSGEEDDDECYETLTAESLFSTLLSRVRDLTQRLNVDDGVRAGFPTSHLLSHFDHGTNFFKRMEPLSRHSSLGRTFSHERPSTKPATPSNDSGLGTPWRRSVSRDLASDIESVFKDTTSPRPRGDTTKNENLNLADLDLKKLKLTDEDALALSYLTPGLSRRIQQQLLAQLAPSEARKLHRTLSSRNSDDVMPESQQFVRRSVDRLSSTLPRRFSVKDDKPDQLYAVKEMRSNKSCLPVKANRDYEFSVRSASTGAEPKFYYRKPGLTRTYPPTSPESSISESLSRNDDSSSYRKDTDSISEISSKAYSDSSASRPYSKYSTDSSYNRYTPAKSYDSTTQSLDNKTDKNKPSTTTNARRISRFLRPDFFDAPKEENIYLKEKKEREMETQKVLKEIRDKRKTRLSMRRERSCSREKEDVCKDTDRILNNVSDSIKSLENNIQNVDYVNVPAQNSDGTIHDYVNVPAAPAVDKVVKKERVSKIARPKSYPAENHLAKDEKKPSPEKESKISKLRKGFVRQSSKEKDKEKTKDDKNETNEGHKNKLLQSIEKKLEKFRLNTSTSGKDPVEIKAIQEKKSNVETAIKRLREQSLPRNLEHCTESGLIKRAVSVEDLTGNKPLQASRKSVTKILGLFKKYEEQDNKKKLVKKNKTAEGKSSSKSKKESDKKTTESVILSNNNNVNDVVDEVETKVNSIENGKLEAASLTDSSQSDDVRCVKLEKKSERERPRSLLFDKMKHFHNAYNGARSDSVVLNDKESKVKSSKLPVNSSVYRRSLNLDNLPEPPKFYPGSSTADRKNLKLDLSKIPKGHSNNLEGNPHQNSQQFLSPGDDLSDSWSVCSDYHTHDLHSPVSPNGLIYSGDENESVIDRIRRKSFYTRFNEKKRPRRSSYKDLELYKDIYNGSLDRRGYGGGTSRSRVEPTKSYCGPRHASASLINDYVNVPNRYQTYSSKFGGRTVGASGAAATSLYSDSEDNALDDVLTTARSRKYSPTYIPTSRLRTSVSPVSEQFFVEQPTSTSLLSKTADVK